MRETGKTDEDEQGERVRGRVRRGEGMDGRLVKTKVKRMGRNRKDGVRLVEVRGQ